MYRRAGPQFQGLTAGFCRRPARSVESFRETQVFQDVTQLDMQRIEIFHGIAAVAIVVFPLVGGEILFPLRIARDAFERIVPECDLIGAQAFRPP